MPNNDRIIDRKLITELTELIKHYKSLSDSDRSSLTRDGISGFVIALQEINPEETTYSQISKLAKQGRELLVSLSTPEQQDEFTFVSEMLQRLRETKAYQATDRIRGAHIPHIAKFLPPQALKTLADVNIDFEAFSEMERLGQLLFIRIIEGNERAIKSILQRYPELMRYRGNITNALGQTFKNVNAFELALHPHQLADLTVSAKLSDAEKAKRRVDAIFSQSYSEEIKQAVKENLGQQLLHHAIRGNQQAVVEILKRYPELLKYRGNVVDNSGREFKNVTAFELALWALDVHHMVPAMLACVTQNKKGEELSPELSEQYEAVTKKGGGVHYTIGCGLLKVSKDPSQLSAAERNELLNRLLDCHNGCIQFGAKLFYFNNHSSPKSLLEITDTHHIKALQSIMDRKDRPLEQDKLQITNQEDVLRVIENVSGSRHIFKEEHYDFTPLTSALEEYVSNYPNWTDEQCIAHWCTVVGLLQRYMPAHVAQHYCNPNESFDPTGDGRTPPTFNEQTLKRTLILLNYLENKLVHWWAMGVGGSSEVLGIDFGNCRAGQYVREGRGGVAVRQGLWGASPDLVALTALCEMRTSELLELKQQLDSLQKPDAGSEPARCSV